MMLKRRHCEEPSTILQQNGAGRRSNPECPRWYSTGLLRFAPQSGASLAMTASSYHRDFCEEFFQPYKQSTLVLWRKIFQCLYPCASRKERSFLSRTPAGIPFLYHFVKSTTVSHSSSLSSGEEILKIGWARRITTNDLSCSTSDAYLCALFLNFLRPT